MVNLVCKPRRSSTFRSSHRKQSCSCLTPTKRFLRFKLLRITTTGRGRTTSRTSEKSAEARKTLETMGIVHLASQTYPSKCLRHPLMAARRTRTANPIANSSLRLLVVAMTSQCLANLATSSSSHLQAGAIPLTPSTIPVVNSSLRLLAVTVFSQLTITPITRRSNSSDLCPPSIRVPHISRASLVASSSNSIPTDPCLSPIRVPRISHASLVASSSRVTINLRLLPTRVLHTSSASRITWMRLLLSSSPLSQ